MARLDSCARLHLDSAGRRGSYFWLGVIGGLVGIGVALALGTLTDAPAASLLIAVAAPLPSFLVAIKVAHILFGYERIVLYEKFAVTLGVAALALHLAGQPVRTGMELVTLGVGTFLVFGRLGCLRVGCCHGRPHRHGIIYGQAHAAAGFPAHLVGVRLFPVQLVESLLTLLLVTMAAVMFVFPHRPGEVVVYYFALYGGVRFTLELIRGDDDRPHALGLSEAQWIAIGSAWLGVWAARAWQLHLSGLYLGAAAALTLGAAVVAVVSRRERWQLEHPRALTRLGRTLARLRTQPAGPVARDETEDGLRLSYSAEADGGEHYGLSRADGALTRPMANIIARQIAQLRRADAPEVIAGRTEGVWHVRVRPA